MCECVCMVFHVKKVVNKHVCVCIVQLITCGARLRRYSPNSMLNWPSRSERKHYVKIRWLVQSLKDKYSETSWEAERSVSVCACAFICVSCASCWLRGTVYSDLFLFCVCVSVCVCLLVYQQGRKTSGMEVCCVSVCEFYRVILQDLFWYLCLNVDCTPLSVCVCSSF